MKLVGQDYFPKYAENAPKRMPTSYCNGSFGDVVSHCKNRAQRLRQFRLIVCEDTHTYNLREQFEEGWKMMAFLTSLPKPPEDFLTPYSAPQDGFRKVALPNVLFQHEDCSEENWDCIYLYNALL